MNSGALEPEDGDFLHNFIEESIEQQQKPIKPLPSISTLLLRYVWQRKYTTDSKDSDKFGELCYIRPYE